MIELVTLIAAGSIAATFFSDILSRVVKTVAHRRRPDADEPHEAPEAQEPQPAH